MWKLELFDDIYDNNDNMDLNQSQHIIYSNQLITKTIVIYILTIFLLLKI